MIRVILVRHGRTAWNVSTGQGPRFRGIIDLPLADEGLVQAQKTAGRLAHLPLAAIYASPLQRALHTAQTIAEPHRLVARPLAGLQSMDYGEWAGLPYTSVAQSWPTLFRKWRHDPFSIQIPGGERYSSLRDRAVAATREVLSSHEKGETIALVSHQAVNKTLICGLMGLPDPAYWWVRQDLCNLSHLDFDPDTRDFTLVSLNDVCHLDRALPASSRGSTRIVLIRHGRTAWNASAGEERFRGAGASDLPLDETGQAQAVATARRLQAEGIVAVYASPLLRTRQTALPLARALDVPVRYHDGLVDIDYGTFQGLTRAEAGRRFPEQYALWRKSPDAVQFPGGESLAHVQARVLALLDELLASHPDQTVALVGHQITNKVIACRLLGLDLDRIWQIQQDTCGLDVFQAVDGTWHVLSLNERFHL